MSNSFSNRQWCVGCVPKICGGQLLNRGQQLCTLCAGCRERNGITLPHAEREQLGDTGRINRARPLGERGDRIKAMDQLNQARGRAGMQPQRIGNC